MATKKTNLVLEVRHKPETIQVVNFLNELNEEQIKEMVYFAQGARFMIEKQKTA